MSDQEEPEPESYVVLYEDLGKLRTSEPMPYAEAKLHAGKMVHSGAMVLSVMTERKAAMYLHRAQQGYFEEESKEAEEPSVALREAVERMEKIITRRDEAGDVVPDRRARHAESRRYQAVELAMELMRCRKDMLPSSELVRSATADQLVKDARLIEKYLKGPASRRTSES